MGYTSVIPCTCYNPGQDKLYGVGKRLHNHATKVNDGRGGMRCTVCLDIKPLKRFVIREVSADE